MARYRFSCNICGREIEIDESVAKAAAKVKCPHCHSATGIPPDVFEDLRERDAKTLAKEQKHDARLRAQRAKQEARKKWQAAEERRQMEEEQRRQAAERKRPERTAAPGPVQGASVAAGTSEDVIWQGKPSYWRYIGVIVLGVLLLVGFGLGIIVIIWAILDRENTVYTVSSQRVSAKRGIIGKQYSEVDCEDVRNVTVSYGVIDSLLGIGEVGVASAGHAGVEIVFKGITAPEEAADAVRRAKARRIGGGSDQ